MLGVGSQRSKTKSMFENKSLKVQVIKKLASSKKTVESQQSSSSRKITAEFQNSSRSCNNL